MTSLAKEETKKTAQLNLEGAPQYKEWKTELERLISLLLETSVGPASTQETYAT